MRKITIKTTTYCLLIFLLGMPAGFAQSPSNVLQEKINFEAKDKKTIEVLNKIEDTTDLKFVYNPNDLDNSTLFSFTKKNVSINNLLIQLFKGSSISFKANGSQVILFKSVNPKDKDQGSIHSNKIKNIVLSGYVLDSETGEAMIAASVYEEKTLIATATNNFGFFSLTLPEGTHNIIVSYIGYESQTMAVEASKKVQIKLIPISNELDAVVISASKEEDKELDAVNSAQMGLLRISSKKLKAIPAMAGEPDILKAITLLPGIAQSVEGSAGFYVRGGGPDQNLILMDGVPMYNPHHLWGYLSTFNPDAINNIEITKGAFPARYGGRLSSVLDITMNDGNNQEWEKKLSVGLLSSRFSFSGPIKEDVSSIFISGRRTVLDLFIAPIAAERDDDYINKPSYNFGDLNLKFNYKLSAKDRIYISGFYSRDNLSLRIKGNDTYIGTQKVSENTGWNNAFGSLRWNHIFGDKLFANTTAYYSHYNYFSDKSQTVEGTPDGILPSTINNSNFSSQINDLTFKQDYQYYLNRNHHIRFGGGVILHEFKPAVNSFSQEVDGQTIRASTPDNTIKANEFSLYLEDNIRINDKLNVNIGVHASAFDVQDTSYNSVQPRLSARYLINEDIAIKIGYSQMTQYLHLLTSSNLIQSSDLWVPVTKNILPPNSTQYSIGTALSIGKQFGLEVEGYYKTMNNLIDYKDGASFLLATGDWESKVEKGEGTSYGVEVFLQKKKGRLTGWFGYTLSWTDRDFKGINFGIPYPYKFDRRHDLSIVGNYQVNKKWSVNSSFIFYSGNNVTLQSSNHITANYVGDEGYGWFAFPGPETVEFSITATNPGFNGTAPSRNNYKLPNYHRLDLTATRKSKTKKDNETEWIFGLTNAYNSFNPSIISQQYEVIGEGDDLQVTSKLSQWSLFPIMPTVSYGFSF